MATATRVISTLQREGLVRTTRGVGTFVVGMPSVPASGGAEASPVAQPRDSGPLNRERIVRAAIAIADVEGLAALSMRRIATSLGVAAMALYRHVPNKEQLLFEMSEAIMGEGALPEPASKGWRAQLETLAKVQWLLFKKHPWMAQVVSFTRPVPAPKAMAHTEWALRAVEGLDLSPSVRFHVVVMLFGYVQGTAVKLIPEHEAEQETGVSSEEWVEATYSEPEAFNPMDGFPILSQLTRSGVDFSLDSLFEFGLQRLLDGLAAMFAAAPAR